MNELQSILQQPLGNAASIMAYSSPATPDTWSCEDWKVRHQMMVKKYGRDRANSLFKSAWEKQSGWDYHFNFCKYNTDWVNYFASQGLDMRSILSTIFTGGTELLDNTLNTVNSTVEATGSLAKSAKFILPVALIGVLGIGGYILYKNSDRVAKLISK